MHAKGDFVTAKKEMIIVSACLLGELVRYNAERFARNWELLEKWRKEGRLAPVCPEVQGGLPVPRPPAEIINGDGPAVWEHDARLRNIEGADVTEEFCRGAQITLETAQRHHIKLAILKESSPSCGVHRIYDGSFSGQKRAGEGVTTALLRSRGIRVFSENELEAARDYLAEIEKQNLNECEE